MAKNTPNYEFEKPEQNDFYDVDVQNRNWDKAETALTEFDDAGSVDEIKSFPDFLKKFVTGNKLAVTMRNLKAGLQFVLHAGQIVNNCVTDNAGLPLSAAQGKVLKDLYTQLYSEMPIIGKFTNKKHKDIIKIGSVVNSRSVVCVFPRYNTLTTVRCIYSSLEISAGEDQFQLLAWDTNTQNDSTSTNLEGYYIVMPMLSK
ncbi:hypothetical protein [Pilosibacter fragilis]|uniref:hypothetical protein n=1 Tax=Pilosibacter fragilis TaxID=3078042 RepID=UPI0032D48F23